MVPAHGECWRRPARRAASLLPEEGHPSVALAMFGEIVDELLASVPRPGG